METIKVILNFCNAAVFYDFKKVGISCELNQVRKCMINNFYKTIPHSKILECLSIYDDIMLKVYGKEIENIFENIHYLRENVLYMLSFEKVVNDEQETIRPILKDDDNDDQQ